MQADRGRRLIEQTADLFSADYPLAELVERLCDALAVAFGGTVFVALVSADSELRPIYSAATGEKSHGEGAPLDRGSRAFAAFSSGESYLERSPHSAMYAPIARRAESLGVIGVEHPSPKTFASEDLRLLEAIARYLAIAVRNQRSAYRAVRPARPALLYAAIAALALALTAAILVYTSIRSHAALGLSQALQRAQAGAVAARLSNYVEHSGQLAGVAASLLGPVRSDRRLVESTLERLLAASGDDSIYGIGVWFEPYKFDRNVRLFGVYVHRPKGSFRGPPVLTYRWTTNSYDYPSRYYYRLGRNANGATVVTDPYFDTDFTYVSTVRAFADRGRFAGVVSVDSIMRLLSKDLQQNSSLPHEVAYATTRDGRQFLVPDSRALLAFARAHGVRARVALGVPRSIFDLYLATLAGDSRTEATARIPHTDWIVHVATSRAQAALRASRLRYRAAGEVAACWLLAGLLMFSVARATRTAERNRTLEMREAELHTEIAERINVEEQLRESAYRDSLTGLANRAALLEQLDRAIRQMRTWPEFFYAVLFLDLDRFNVVNDSLGHDAGDKLLTLIARRLTPLLRPEDLLARLGGDEFVFLLQSGEGLADALDLAGRVQQAFGGPFTVEGQEVFVSASIGIATGEWRYDRSEQVLRDADLAMYQAKRRGRGQFAVFERSMHERIIAQLELESDLRRALARDELFVEFQPIIAIADGGVAGFEALARWNHPRRGTVMPGEFIPLAEQTGLIGDVDRYVIEQACRLAAPWVEEFPGLYLAVNASAADLSRGTLPRMVGLALDASAFPASSLKIEITETAVMENAEAARDLLGTLPEGVRIQIDDFGTGYSSLSYLQALPIDELKIDASFVGGMMRSAEAAEIVRAIASLAQTLRLNVTAEGVEREEQVTLLRELGVEFAQGYFYTKALGAADVPAYLRATSATRV